MGRKYYLDPETGEKIYIRDKAPSLKGYRTAIEQDAIDNDKVRKVAGKSLSTNDYDNVAKAKVDAIPENPAIGKVLKVMAVNEDGTFTCEWSDESGGGGITEVIDDDKTSFIADGVATIPRATDKAYGLIKQGNGLYINSSGVLQINTPTSGYMSARSKTHGLTLNFFDEMLKYAMTDGKGAAWTAEERTGAQSRIGLQTLTQEEYDLLDTPDPSTFYFIVEEST